MFPKIRKRLNRWPAKAMLAVATVLTAAGLAAAVPLISHSQGNQFSLTLNPPDNSVTGYVYSADGGQKWHPVANDGSSSITGPGADQVIAVMIQGLGGVVALSFPPVVTPIQSTPTPTQQPPQTMLSTSLAVTLTASSDTPGDVLLTWDEAAAPNNTYVYAYAVERSPTGRSNQSPEDADYDWEYLGSVDADQTREYADWGLTAGMTWHYRVRAEYADGEAGQWSSIVSATVSGWPPQAPWVSAFATGTSVISVQWEVYHDENDPITKHEIQYSERDEDDAYINLNTNLSATTTSYHHSVGQGNTRWHRVRSCNSNGCGEWGDAGHSVTAGANAVPTAPTLTATTSGIIHNEATVTLTIAHSDAGGIDPVEGYEVECSDDGLNWYNPYQCGWNLGPSELSVTHKYLPSGTVLHYRALAHNTNGSSAWSTPVRIQTKRGAPDMVRNVTVATVPLADGEAMNSRNAKIAVTWEEPGYGAPITQYVVQTKDYSVERPETAAERTAREALEAAGDAADAARDALRDAESRNDDAATIERLRREYHAALDAMDPLTAAYEAAVDAAEWNTAVTLSGSIAQKSYVVTGLYTGTNYGIRVVARNNIGLGHNGNVEMTTTEGESQWAPSEAPFVRIESISANSVTFEWDPAYDGGRPITRYVYDGVKKCVNESTNANGDSNTIIEEFNGEVNGSVTRVTLTGLNCPVSQSTEEFDFRVIPWNELGEGMWPNPMYTMASLPNRGGHVNVSVTDLVVPEGQTRTFTVGLNRAPEKAVLLSSKAVGDWEIVDQVEEQLAWWNTRQMLPEDWSAVTITVTNEENDDQSGDRVAVAHYGVSTEHYNGPHPKFPDATLDRRFDSVSGRSVRIVFQDND